MKICFPDFNQAKVLVVGDVMLDRYWHGGTSRISPEAPVPVVKVDQIEERPGGAGNVALNISHRSGVSSENRTTQSTAPSPANTAILRSTGFTGLPGPFNRVTESSSLTATIRRSPNCRASLR